MPGVLFCRSAHQALKGAPWVGSYSVIWHISLLKEHPGWGSTLEFSVSDIWQPILSIVQLPMLVWGGREAMVMVPPPMHDSAISLCFHGCSAFLHRQFPPQSPHSHPLNPSLHSQQHHSPWDCSTIPKLQPPATVPSRVCMHGEGLSDSHSI